MSISALLVSALVEGLLPGQRVLSCTFPALTAKDRAITVSVEPLPSLRDRIDRFRIMLHIDDGGRYGGLAQPIDRTADRDVLIRAETSEDFYYTIGVRDDGRAALNLLEVLPEAVIDRRETRAGTCRDFETVLDGWLAS